MLSYTSHAITFSSFSRLVLFLYIIISVENDNSVDVLSFSRVIMSLALGFQFWHLRIIQYESCSFTFRI